MPYPVVVTVETPPEPRNRLTAALRLILAIPHAILVGPVKWTHDVPQGFLAAAAYFLAVVSWFMILITGEHPQGIRDFCMYYFLPTRIRHLATALIPQLSRWPIRRCRATVPASQCG